MNLQSTPLLSSHQKLNAKLVDFSGYNLPVWYSSLREEHLAVRTHSGMFDVSHMGAIRLTGGLVEDLLSTVTCSSLKKACRSIMTYSMILNESGGVMDDIMMGKVDSNEWLMIVNASNKAKILQWLRRHSPSGVTADFIDTYAMLAVQGPQAITHVEPLVPEASTLSRFEIKAIELNGTRGYIMRTGYTGEDGVELIIPGAQAPVLFEALIKKGVVPCGLASRDSLRIEAGLPLYGHELSEDISPLDTRYRWVIDWNGHFIGKSALVEFKNSRSNRHTIGIRVATKQIPRQGSIVEDLGVVTSGSLPPGYDEAIAMAIVTGPVEVGQPITVQIRGNRISGTVVEVPFKS
ncbi:glycine cleavage system aminomethyltransferase GcvT [bacterium]|nr:glycine cleavage system aminomethyltransferase GcvT [bacterium]